MKANPKLAKDLGTMRAFSLKILSFHLLYAALVFTDVIFEDDNRDAAVKAYHRAVFERERSKAARTRILEILDGVHW